MRPKKVNILGKVYSIIYVDNPVDVDSNRREPLFGQIDHWARTIRVREMGETDTLDTQLHEVLHALIDILHIDIEEEEEVVALLAMGLADVLTRNGWMKE